MLLGCEEGRCRFATDSEYIIKEYERAWSILELLGMWKRRLVLVQLPAFDGRGFVAQVMNFIAQIEQRPAFKRAGIMGPRPPQDIEAQSHF